MIDIVSWAPKPYSIPIIEAPILNTVGYTLPRFGWLVELEHGAQGDSSLAT